MGSLQEKLNTPLLEWNSILPEVNSLITELSPTNFPLSGVYELIHRNNFISEVTWKPKCKDKTYYNKPIYRVKKTDTHSILTLYAEPLFKKHPEQLFSATLPNTNPITPLAIFSDMSGGTNEKKLNELLHQSLYGRSWSNIYFSQEEFSHANRWQAAIYWLGGILIEGLPLFKQLHKENIKQITYSAPPMQARLQVRRNKTEAFLAYSSDDFLVINNIT